MDPRKVCVLSRQAREDACGPSVLHHFTVVRLQHEVFKMAKKVIEDRKQQLIHRLHQRKGGACGKNASRA